MIVKKSKGGGLAINPNHIFADSTARDAYFVAHPTELVKGTFISVGTDYEEYDGVLFEDKTSVVTGPAGNAGSIQVGTVTTLSAGSSATVTNVGTTNSAIFDFGIPKGADGAGGGSATWGGITGTLSAQTDLNSALNGKQATLVSGTNIKTINGTSILGSGNMVISGGAGAVDSVNTKTGVVTLNQDEILDGTTYKQYSQTEKAKVGVITTSGDGSQYLANDGTYKTIGSGGSVAFADITSKPTTVAGYGITDAVDTFSAQTIGGSKTFSAIVGFNSMAFFNSTGYAKNSFNIAKSNNIANAISGVVSNIFGDSTGSLVKFTNNATEQLETDGLDIGITADGTAEIRQRENLPLNIYTNNSLVATFDETGVTSNLSGTWSTISDERLKENIVDISEPIAKIESIAKCVKQYNFINQDKYAKGLRTGYIAQLLAENGFEGHVTQRKPNDEEEGALFGWTYKDGEYENIEKEFILNENNEQIVKENVVIKTRRVVDKEGEMVLGIENNFTPYLFPAFIALLERVKALEEKVQGV